MIARPAAVAGQFYPGRSTDLRRAVAAAFADAVVPPADTVAPKALIVPHAGLPYSGAIAASAYLTIAPARATIRRVVLLGPSHRVRLDGLAVPSVDAFATPFGDVPLDAALRRRALAIAGVTLDDAAHRFEHSLEVQLPFLQTVLDDFALLPLVVGAADGRTVAHVLDAVWGGQETLVVVSSDLSHYHGYDEAAALDAVTAAIISAGDAAHLDDSMACGARPVRGLLLAAREHRLTIEQIDLRNSGDTAGDRHRVVGYGAFALR